MSSIVSAKRLAAPIEVQVNGHSWVLTHDEARQLRNKIGVALDIHNEQVIERLKEICCRKFNVSMSALMSDDRHDQVAKARQCVMWLAREGGFAVKVIANHLNRDHTAVSHGVQTMNDRMTRGSAGSAEWRSLVAHLKKQAEEEMNVSFPATIKAIYGAYH